MSFLSWAFSKIAKLPAPETTCVLVERDLKIPMSDGAVLLADRYAPKDIENPPVILVRSCYGRRGFFGLTTAYVYRYQTERIRAMCVILEVASL